MNFWILKTEPETYSFKRLLREGTTNWDQVRNYQARNNLRSMQVGDECWIYHSGEERCIVGLARVIRTAYPDFDSESGMEWVQVDIQVLQEAMHPVSLSECKKDPELSQTALVKQSRLSVIPITALQSQRIRELCF